MNSFMWGVLFGVAVAHFIYTVEESAKIMDDWMQGHHD